MTSISSIEDAATTRAESEQRTGRVGGPLGMAHRSHGARGRLRLHSAQQMPPAHGRYTMEGIPMPDPQLILVVLLLAAAVMYGYFYFKRAQARSADAAPVSSPAASTSTTPREPADKTQ